MVLRDWMKKDLTHYFVDSISVILLIALNAIVFRYFWFRHFLPSGVNEVFVAWIWKLFILLLPFLMLFFVLYLYLVRGKRFFYDKKFEKLQASDFIFILIPMIPILQYVISNQDSLTIYSSFFVLLFFTVFSVIFCIIIPVLLSLFASKYVLIAASTSFLFVILNMASLSAIFYWHFQGSLKIQLAILISAFLILLAYNVMPKKVFNSAILLYFLLNIITGIWEIAFNELENNDFENLPVASALEELEERTIEQNNDVFLIVYEAYSNYETMKHYGFDNSDQLNFLEANGFHVYHGVYTIGVTTIMAMSRVFNLEREIGSLCTGRKYVAGNGVVHSVFQQEGYKTCGVFPSNYFLTGLSIDEIKYDLSFPAPIDSAIGEAGLLVDAIFAGEFRDEIGLGEVDYDLYLEEKQNVLKGAHSSPAFMYAHSRYPGHGPTWGMSIDGADKWISRHFNRIENANAEMTMDVKKIVNQNPDAIVIIAGDHGPFMTKTGYRVHLNPDEYSAEDINRYDVQDRYGAFLAIRWPESNYAKKHDIKILQDIFPAVFAYLFDDTSLFDKIRIQDRTTLNPQITSGVYVEDGIVVGGKDDGQPLFNIK